MCGSLWSNFIINRGFIWVKIMSDCTMNEPGGYITRQPVLPLLGGSWSLSDLSIRPLHTTLVCVCGRALRLAASSVQWDEVVNLHECARCQNSRWELTLAQGASVACFRWRRIQGCVMENKIRSFDQRLQRGAKWFWHQGKLELYLWIETLYEWQVSRNKGIWKMSCSKKKDAWSQSNNTITCWNFISLAKYADKQ